MIALDSQDREAVLRFQAAHRNHMGERLALDGAKGPQTRWALAFASLDPGRQAIVRAAAAELGVAEISGSNRDREGKIDLWLRRCGVGVGNPWCAAFASWCLRGVESLSDVAVAGACNLGRKFPATLEPYPGDLMWYPTDSKGRGHIGIVTGVTLSEVMTIEGNQRNAVRCVRRDRHAVRFSRVPLPTTGEVPGIPPGVPFVATDGMAGTR
jgi:hypothetical protein